MSILSLPVTSPIAPPPDSIVSGILNLVSGGSSEPGETESGASSGTSAGLSGTEPSTSTGQGASDGSAETGGSAGSSSGVAASVGTPADESPLRMEFSTESAAPDIDREREMAIAFQTREKAENLASLIGTASDPSASSETRAFAGSLAALHPSPQVAATQLETVA